MYINLHTISYTRNTHRNADKGRILLVYSLFSMSILRHKLQPSTYELPPISYVREMGGSSIAGGFMFRTLLVLNRLKP